jgi:hypothetical protein
MRTQTGKHTDQGVRFEKKGREEKRRGIGVKAKVEGRR